MLIFHAFIAWLFHTFPPCWSSPGTNGMPLSSSILPSVTAWHCILFIVYKTFSTQGLQMARCFKEIHCKGFREGEHLLSCLLHKRWMRSRTFSPFYNKAEIKSKAWISKTLNKVKWMLSLGSCQAFGQQELCSWVWKYNAGNPTDNTHTTFASFNHCGSHLDEEQSTKSVEEGHFSFNMTLYWSFYSGFGSQTQFSVLYHTVSWDRVNSQLVTVFQRLLHHIPLLQHKIFSKCHLASVSFWSQ